jgi:chromosome segregation ATPase
MEALRTHIEQLSNMPGAEDLLARKKAELQALADGRRAKKPVHAQLREAEQKLATKQRQLDKKRLDVQKLEEQLKEAREAQARLEADVATLRVQRDQLLQAPSDGDPKPHVEPSHYLALEAIVQFLAANVPPDSAVAPQVEQLRGFIASAKATACHKQEVKDDVEMVQRAEGALQPKAKAGEGGDGAPPSKRLCAELKAFLQQRGVHENEAGPILQAAGRLRG